MPAAGLQGKFSGRSPEPLSPEERPAALALASAGGRAIGAPARQRP